MNHQESKIQQAIIKWFDYAHKSLGVTDHRLLFAIPNGGRRNAREAARMKSEGIRSGIPDLFLAIKKKEFGGLFIELKSAKGVISINQESCMNELEKKGYCVEVCYAFDSAKEIIENYLK